MFSRRPPFGEQVEVDEAWIWRELRCMTSARLGRLAAPLLEAARCGVLSEASRLALERMGKVLGERELGDASEQVTGDNQ